MSSSPATTFHAGLGGLGRRRGISPGPAGPRPAISFAYGLPDPALFPTEALAAAAAKALLQHGDRALQYGGMPGAPPLVAGLLGRLRDREGLDLSAGQCLITPGSSQAIGLVARALVAPGDAVLLETPAWPGVINALRRYEARAIPVPMGSGGPRACCFGATLERLLARRAAEAALYRPTSRTPPASP